MAENASASGSTPKGKKTAPKPPPRNFVVSWKEEEQGPTLGYAIAELVAYFPATVGRQSRAKGQQNVADPAFAELFAPGADRQVVLKAVALPTGVIADSSFRVEVASMSGDVRHKEPD